jgi:hypothetical protein
MFLKKKNFFIFLSLLILSFFIFLSVNFELRRSIFSRILVLHDFYRIKKLTIGLQNRDFKLIAVRLQEYIDFSKLISKGKNYMFHGIYDAIDLAVSRAIEQEDFNNLENIFKQLIDLDNRVYKPHVWYARALSDNNKEEALKHLDIAIEISPSESEAYREIIKIGQSQDDRTMTSKYCEIYNKALSGGSQPSHYSSHYSPLFNSFNNDKFAIKLISKNNKKSTNYLSATTLLNEINIYEFLLPTELFEIDQLNLYFSSAEALKIKFKKINYHDDNKINEIDFKDLTVTSQNSYIEESEDGVSVFLIPKKDEVIRISHRTSHKTKKLQIVMSIEKMNIASKSLCKN